MEKLKTGGKQWKREKQLEAERTEEEMSKNLVQMAVICASPMPICGILSLLEYPG